MRVRRQSRTWLAVSIAAGLATGIAALLSACSPVTKKEEAKTLEFLTEPLVTDIYTADPSAHVFNGKLYIYPSHDVESEVQKNGAAGAGFDMRDYHVFSMDNIDAPVRDHGVVLSLEDIPWATKQLWAPDVAEKDGRYYFYFPAKDQEGLFRIGVAVGDRPEGPFVPDPEPIANTYSMDPAVFQDADGSYYMYFGGIEGGQLQHWIGGVFSTEPFVPTSDQPAIMPRVAKLADDMRQLAEIPRNVELLDKNGQPIKAGDKDRLFFEAAWVHKYNGKYYFSYSTGGTHFIQYATGDNPYGPFTYQGKILEPVLGWTTHHSIVEFNDRWWLFYHDSELSGSTYLRNMKMVELTHKPDGSIETLDVWLAD